MIFDKKYMVIIVDFMIPLLHFILALSCIIECKKCLFCFKKIEKFKKYNF